MSLSCGIEEFKKCAGFEAGTSALYKTWRNAVKLQMLSLKITGKNNAGQRKWAKLTMWAISKRPLRSKAALHGTKSADGAKFTRAVDGLLADVAKKLAHTRRRQEDLDAPPEAPCPEPLGSSKCSL